MTVAATAGTFSLLYLGTQSRRVYALVQDGSAQVRLLTTALTVAPNDFLRIAGALYQVKSVGAADPTAVTLTAPFAGGFTDIAQVRPCHRTTMPPCHHAAMPPCHHATMPPCRHATMPPCRPAALPPPHKSVTFFRLSPS